MKGVEREEEISAWLDYTADRPFNDHRYPMDSSKLKSLGWNPKVEWEEGISMTSECICAAFHQNLSNALSSSPGIAGNTSQRSDNSLQHSKANLKSQRLFCLRTLPSVLS